KWLNAGAWTSASSRDAPKTHKSNQRSMGELEPGCPRSVGCPSFCSTHCPKRIETGFFQTGSAPQASEHWTPCSNEADQGYRCRQQQALRASYGPWCHRGRNEPGNG